MTMSPKNILHEPDVFEAAGVLVEKVMEAAARNGQSVSSLIVITNGDIMNSLITTGCCCEGCLSNMIETLVNLRDGTLGEPSDDSGCGVH